MPTLETERLLLRPLTNDDLDELAAIVADPEVQRFIGGGVHDRAAAWRQMAIFRGHDALRGFSQNAVVERSTGRLVGRAGLWLPEGWPGLEVGWVLARDVWGRGYATEAGCAWRDWAFDVLGADDLISVIHPDNIASMRVAERIGHVFRERRQIVNGTVNGEFAVYGQRPAGPRTAQSRRAEPS
jgi:RimJ/RimL family protein N-acetyltransferase